MGWTSKSKLMKKVDQELNNAMNGLTNQLNVVQSLVQSPMKAIVGMVAGGSVWRGEGATKFTDMVNNQFLPLAQLGGQNINTTAMRLRQAKELVDMADQWSHVRINNMRTSFWGRIWIN